MVAALGGVAVNGARAVGPALAGVLLAQVGSAVVFVVSAVSALAFVVVLLRTRRPSAAPVLPPERFASALRAGGRYVRNSPAVRRMLLLVFLFVLPGAAVWALLPVVADRLLRGGSTGFGVLLGSLGAGAVLGGRAAAPPDGSVLGQPVARPVRGAVRRVARRLRDGAGPRSARRVAGPGRDGVAVRADERHRRAAGLPTSVGTRPRAVHLQRGLRRVPGGGLAAVGAAGAGPWGSCRPSSPRPR
jgi:hypothetical protein